MSFVFLTKVMLKTHVLYFDVVWHWRSVHGLQCFSQQTEGALTAFCQALQALGDKKIGRNAFTDFTPSPHAGPQIIPNLSSNVLSMREVNQHLQNYCSDK